jgi:hypothetical protein
MPLLWLLLGIPQPPSMPPAEDLNRFVLGPCEYRMRIRLSSDNAVRRLHVCPDGSWLLVEEFRIPDHEESPE